jgi:hypothetical protein
MNANTLNNGAEPIASPLRFPTPDGGEIAKFLGSAASLWAKQRDKLESLESAYAAQRFEIVGSYQKRMQALANEAQDMLRDMDRKHAAAVAEGKRMLAALDALRDS